jgi:hypothetical protein
MTWRIECPSDQPANCSTVPSGAIALLGAAIWRWKPTTPSTVVGVATGTLSRVSPSPGGEVCRVRCDVRGRIVTVFVVDSPLPSVAVTVTS